MSIATEFTRIQSDRNTIRNKLVELGMANSTDKLDALASAIENLINQGAVKVEVREGETYTIPAGYHNGSGTVSGVKGGGNYTLQEKTVTPTKQQLHIASDDGYYGLSAVTVNAIPDAYQDVTSVTATADKVLVGKIFVDKEGNVIAGTMTDHTNDSSIVPLTVERNTYTIPAGYHDGKRSVGIAYGTTSVTPSKERQTVQGSDSADDGSGNLVNHEFLSAVIVEPIPLKYQDVSGVTAKASHVLSGDVFVNAVGTAVTGTMPNKGDVSDTIDGFNKTSVTIPVGYTSGGTISLTNDIENALKEI